MSLINKHTIFGLILLSFIFSGCNKGRVFHEVKKFDDFKWHKSEKIYFEVIIDQNNSEYDLFLNLRYIEGFPYKFLNLEIDITDPDEKTKTNISSIQIISNKKKYIGDGAGSYWDLDYQLPEYEFIESGKYKITITHVMDENVLNWINEVGLSVKETAQ